MPPLPAELQNAPIDPATLVAAVFLALFTALLIFERIRAAADAPPAPPPTLTVSTAVSKRKSYPLDSTEVARAAIARPGYIWIATDGHAYQKTAEVRATRAGEFQITPTGMIEGPCGAPAAVWKEVDADLILEGER